MSSTPDGLQLQYLDHIPLELRPKPLYGNIVDVSRTTGKCTIVTWPSSARQRQRQKTRTYTFMLSDLPKTQASRVLQRALMSWVEEVLNAATPQSGGGVTGTLSKGGKQSQASSSKHKRNISLPHSTASIHHDREVTRSVSQLSMKEQHELFTGPRVTFLDEEDMFAPPPLPPKDARYTQFNSLSPISSPNRRKQQRHHQRRKSEDQSRVGTAVDIGLVWWESDLHGKRV